MINWALDSRIATLSHWPARYLQEMEDQHPDQRAQQTDLALQWVTHMEITIYGICSVTQLQKKAVRIAFLGARARMTLQLWCTQPQQSHQLNSALCLCPAAILSKPPYIVYANVATTPQSTSERIDEVGW
jgi:hypothetical protein